MWPQYQKSGSRRLTLREPLWLSWLKILYIHCVGLQVIAFLHVMNLDNTLRYRPPVLIIIFFYKIYSLCKNIAISKVLNKLQVFHFRSTVHTHTTPTVITHSRVLQKPLFCNDNCCQFELRR